MCAAPSSSWESSSAPFGVGDIVEQHSHYEWPNYGKDAKLVAGPEPRQKGSLWKVIEITSDHVRLELISGGYDLAGYTTDFMSCNYYKERFPGRPGNAQILDEFRRIRQLSQPSKPTQPSRPAPPAAPAAPPVVTALPPIVTPPPVVSNECKPLLAMASGELYRRNLFRVLGLPLSASAAEVWQRQKRLSMRQKLGLDVDAPPSGAMPLQPPPDAQQTTAALDRLNDPESRFLDEIFWFWPLHDAHDSADAALAALERGQIEEARRLWIAASTSAGRGSVAGHNLAVLHHLLAMDAELTPAAAAGATRDEAALSSNWALALLYWKQTIDGEPFWTRCRERVRELNDLKLTTGLVRRIRDTLPRMLLTINAELAVAAAQKNDTRAVRMHLDAMKKSDFDPSLAIDVLRDALGPLRQQLKASCDAADPRADADPEHADRVVEELLPQFRSILAVIDAVLPAGDPIALAARDLAAQTLLSCQITFGNKTDNWTRSLALLDRIRPLAGGDAMRDRIDRNIAIVRDNAGLIGCFFCGDGAAVKEAEIRVPLSRDNVFNSPRVVRVPRCRICRDLHQDYCNAMDLYGHRREEASRAAFPKLDSQLKKAAADIAAASRLPSPCPRCSGTKLEKSGLCPNCDRDLVRKDPSRFAGAFWLTVLVALLSWQAYKHPDLVATSQARIGCIGVVLLLSLGWSAWENSFSKKYRRLQEMAELRTKQEQERQKRLAEAQAWKAQLQQQLEDAKASRMREFAEQNALPQFPATVKPESEFVQYPEIQQLRSQQWGFGKKPAAHAADLAASPRDVEGLVRVGGQGSPPPPLRVTPPAGPAPTPTASGSGSASASASGSSATRSAASASGASSTSASGSSSASSSVTSVSTTAVPPPIITPPPPAAPPVVLPSGETTLYRITGEISDISISADSAHWVFATKDGRYDVVADGATVGRHDEIKRYSVTMNEAGSHYRYIARTGSEWRVVLDGKQWRGYDEVDDTAISDSQWTHVAATVRKGNRWLVVVDDQPGPAYDQIAQHTLRVGDINGAPHLAFVARIGSKWAVVVDGRARESFDEIKFLSVDFKPEGIRVVHLARSGSKWCVVRDGAQLKQYDEIDNLRCSFEDPRLIRTVRSGGQWRLMVDDNEYRPYDSIVEHSVTLSPDRSRIGYVARMGGRCRVVIDGREDYDFDAIDNFSLKFSPDSQHYAYVAARRGRKCVIFDGAVQRECDEMDYWKLIFSPNSRRLAYVLEFKGSPINSREIVADGKTLLKTDRVCSEPYFSPDSKSIVYELYLPDGQAMVYNGQTGNTYEEILWPKKFLPDGRFLHLARHSRRLMRIIRDVRP